VILTARELRNGDAYFSPSQAARVLRVTPTRVRQLLQAGELEGERDGAGHWSIPARAVVDRLERLRREWFVEAAVYEPVRVREAQERAEVLQREVGRLEGRLESEEEARRYLEADRVLLAQRLERERLRREEVEQERDELLRRLEVLSGPPSVEEATAGEAGREVLGQADTGAPEDAERGSWWRSVFGRHRSG
jgi:excisionase family DNA binding protein